MQKTEKQTNNVKTKRVREYNRPNKINFICNICTGGFELRTSIEAHLNLHLNKFETCDQCDSKFSTKATLNRHISLLHGSGSVKKKKKRYGTAF